MDFESILLTVLLWVGCVLLSAVLKGRKAALLERVTLLVQEAEAAIRGSGLGAEKKSWVIAQLQAGGVRVNDWLSAQIDEAVRNLNTQGAWLAGQAREKLEGDHE